jgi:hypothetical protein
MRVPTIESRPAPDIDLGEVVDPRDIRPRPERPDPIAKVASYAERLAESRRRNARLESQVGHLSGMAETDR